MSEEITLQSSGCLICWAFSGVTVMNLMHTKYFYDTFTFTESMTEGERAWSLSSSTPFFRTHWGLFVTLWRRSKYFDKNAMNITVVFYACLIIFWGYVSVSVVFPFHTHLLTRFFLCTSAG